MFRPRYTITDRLLANIKKINSLVLELNNKKFPKVVLYELERRAREISTFASTSIEGNPLPLTDVKHILKTRPEHITRSEQEVINYNQALEQLNQRLQQGSVAVRLDLILHIHKQVTTKLVPNSQEGNLREYSVFVNNPRTGETIYWPPDARDVPDLMDELIEFTHTKGAIDPLIVSGIFHKQFVIIHPFLDGNGRTVRLATKVLLADMGLNTFNLFSFENYYNMNVTNYFHNVGVLGNYYDLAPAIDFTKWLEYFADGIIDELLRVKKLLPEVPFTPQTTLKPYHEKILEWIREKDFIKDPDYARLTKRAKATRNLDFKKLINLDLIVRKGKGRATYYVLKSGDTEI